MTETTFYWHDYETFGADPARDRPSQFAGIRTDLNFNVMGDPLMIYCQPAADMLPHPEACLITGITPQEALEKGVCEAEFIRRIHAELAQPGTCGVGYNSIRFDDEVSRYTLYRNFYDPYTREWQNGNSRWDIIDMVRVCCALRPEGIEWPVHEDGTPSFKLEHLTAANGISHEAAHDALSDVYATIAMAKLIKEKQPRLFDYLFKLRNKHEVSALLNIKEQQPVLHTSAMFPAKQFCTTLVMPLTMHPTNKNAVIAFDLRTDPSPLIDLDAEAIKERLYTPAAELPEGVERIPLKTISINRCPVVATTKLLDDDAAKRIQLDMEKARKHYRLLREAAVSSGAAFIGKLKAVFSESDFPVHTDPDLMLYSGGFFGQNDKTTMTQIRNCSIDELKNSEFFFEDGRLAEMLLRYKGRNFPAALSADELLHWQEYCFQRLTNPDAGGSITLDAYHETIEAMLNEPDISDEKRSLLHSLREYGEMVLA